jgi:beta-lactamase class D
MSENRLTTSQEIASLLMNVVQLPSGHTYISLFGNGDESTDLEAMTFWVESHLLEIDAAEVVQRLQNLANQHQEVSHRGNHAVG